MAGDLNRYRAAYAISLCVLCLCSNSKQEKEREVQNIIAKDGTNTNQSDTKSKTLYDYQTRVVAYKDLVESKCLLEILNSGDSLISQRKSHAGVNSISKDFLTSNKLSKRQIWRIAGSRITEFCQGFPTYLIRDVGVAMDDPQVILNGLSIDVDFPPKRREKRQTRQYSPTRVRGQTQSQYLNFGKSDYPGKAEAESTINGSKAVVTGMSGMGQAQSQSFPSGCEECGGGIQDQVLAYGRGPAGPPGAPVQPEYWPSGVAGRPGELAQPSEYPGRPGGVPGFVGRPGELPRPGEYPGGVSEIPGLRPGELPGRAGVPPGELARPGIHAGGIPERPGARPGEYPGAVPERPGIRPGEFPSRPSGVPGGPPRPDEYPGEIPGIPGIPGQLGRPGEFPARPGADVTPTEPRIAGAPVPAPGPESGRFPGQAPQWPQGPVTGAEPEGDARPTRPGEHPPTPYERPPQRGDQPAAIPGHVEAPDASGIPREGYWPQGPREAAPGPGKPGEAGVGEAVPTQTGYWPQGPTRAPEVGGRPPSGAGYVPGAPPSWGAGLGAPAGPYRPVETGVPGWTGAAPGATWQQWPPTCPPGQVPTCVPATSGRPHEAVPTGENPSGPGVEPGVVTRPEAWGPGLGTTIDLGHILRRPSISGPAEQRGTFQGDVSGQYSSHQGQSGRFHGTFQGRYEGEGGTYAGRTPDQPGYGYQPVYTPSAPDGRPQLGYTPTGQIPGYGVGVAIPGYPSGSPPHQAGYAPGSQPGYSSGISGPGYGPGTSGPGYGAGIPGPSYGTGISGPGYGPGISGPGYGQGLYPGGGGGGGVGGQPTSAGGTPGYSAGTPGYGYRPAAGQPGYGPGRQPGYGVAARPGSQEGHETGSPGTTGHAVPPAAPGYGVQFGTPGYGAQPGTPGYGTQPGGLEYGGQVGTPGYGTQPGGPGYSTQVGTPGYGNKPGGPEYGGQIATPGYGTQPGGPGYGSQIAIPGYGTQSGPGYGQPAVAGATGRTGYGPGVGGTTGAAGYGPAVQPGVGQPGYTGVSQPGQPGYSGVSQPGQPGYTGVSQPGQTGYTGASQPGQTGYTGISQPGQTGYTGVLQPGQTGYTGVSQPGQTGYTGVSQPRQTGYTGVSQPGQTGYTGVSQPGQTGYTGVSQPGQPGYTGVSQAGQPGYTGVSQPGQTGYTGVSQPGQPGYTGVAQAGQPGYSGVPQPGQPGYTQSGAQGYTPESLTRPGVGTTGQGGTDDADSQVQSSVHQTANETQAEAHALGKYRGGTANSQVSGTYTGTGSFSAQAGSDDGQRGAQTQVSGGSEGARSSAQGKGGMGQSQAQVVLSSDTGDTLSSAQTGGLNHGSQTEVQASEKGGVADAQANGPGLTQSQAQIGFKPYDESQKDDDGGSPFRGGGMAAAQSGTHTGMTQSQIQGSFLHGIRYTGAAQAGSGTSDQRNLTARSEFFKPLNFTVEKSSVKKQQGAQQTQALQSDGVSSRKTVRESNEKPRSPPGQEETQTTPKYNGSTPDDYTDADQEYPSEEYEDDNEDAPQTRSIASQASKNTIGQIGKNQRQKIILDPLENLDATVHQSNGDALHDGMVLLPGDTIPGMPGHKIPEGFRGRVRALANGRNTYAIGKNSQAQSVTLSPGSGKIIYRSPVYSVSSKTLQKSGRYGYGSGFTYQAEHQPVQYRYKNGKVLPNFVTSSKSETGTTNLVTGKRTPSVYYTQSSSCGIFVNSCVYSNGKKVCVPKPKTNPDGSIMSC